MKKYIKHLTLLFIGGIIFNYSSVSATRIIEPITPACKVTGTIESISFEDKYDNPCLYVETPFGVGLCPTDVQLHFPARYSLGVKIESVVYIEGDKDFITCEERYKVGSVENIYINKDKVKAGDIFSLNQKIEVTNNPNNDESFNSYILKTDKNINKETSSIPKTDKKIYKTSIIKKGKLLFFIPISLNIQTTIDLNTGMVVTDIVKETKKQWWSFLVKF